jgi:hypothetical protein
MHRRSFLAALAGMAAAGPALAGDEAFRIRELYEKDLSFTGFAEDMKGDRIVMQGYMAPPLKAESQFFVLTARPMAVCPFCETEAEWPNDIVAVYTKRVIDVVPFNVPIVTRGTLELGTLKDPETGFVSRARIVDSIYERS